MKVVYGHTDSIYVQIDSIEKAKEVVKEVNEHVQKIFPNVFGLEQHPVDLEFEKYYSTLGVGTVKNRNAGLISWEDGRFLDKQKFIMTGFAAKRVSQTQLEKRIQMKVLEMWVGKKTLAEVNEYLHEEYVKTLHQNNLPLSDIVKRSRLRKDRFVVQCPCGKKYDVDPSSDNSIYEITYCGKCGEPKSKFKTMKGKRPTFGEGVAGILFGRERGRTYEDSFLFMKVDSTDSFANPMTDEKRRVEYVAENSLEDFKSYKIDWSYYANKIVSKAEPIYKAMGWDISSIVSGSIQSSFEEWW